MRPEPGLPDVFGPYFGKLEEQRYAGRSEDLFHGCFGCGLGPPDGLYVRCFKTVEGVASPIIIPRKYEGPQGAAQGGIVVGRSLAYVAAPRSPASSPSATSSRYRWRPR